MTVIAVPIPPDAEARLRAAAEARGGSVEETAALALQEWLADDAAWAAAVEDGLAAIDRGEGVSEEDFRAEMDAFMAALNAHKG
jgi:predicted transcriptional regulator